MTRLLSLLMTLLSLTNLSLATYYQETGLGGNLYLVNKRYRLSQDYEPNDLVSLNVKYKNGNVRMRREAAEQLEKMFRAAAKERMDLLAVSGYRSYGKQNYLHQRKIRNSGGDPEMAELLVAPPGASEHQLGLAIDLGLHKKQKQNLTVSFGRSKEGKWVREHCHEYGFILRYQQRWTDITGYANEPWHFRYVGVEHAALIKKLDVPFETYVDLLLKARENMEENR